LPSDILSGAIGAGLAAVLILLGWLLLRRTKGGSPAVADPDPYASSAGSPLARNILDAITEPFLAVDHEWRLVYANAAAHRFLGFGGTDEIGNDFWRILPQGMESSFRLALLRAPEQRETVTFQTFSDPPGLWLEVSGYPYESGLILSLRDITPRKWA